MYRIRAWHLYTVSYVRAVRTIVCWLPLLCTAVYGLICEHAVRAGAIIAHFGEIRGNFGVILAENVTFPPKNETSVVIDVARDGGLTAIVVSSFFFFFFFFIPRRVGKNKA